jgi:tetratricopeptide (TPR) repeat protein
MGSKLIGMQCVEHNQPLNKLCISEGCTTRSISCELCITLNHKHKKLETLRRDYFEDKVKRLLDYDNLSSYMVAEKEEIRKKMSRLFYAMRDEMEDVINETITRVDEFIKNFLSGENDHILGDLQENIRLIQNNKYDSFQPAYIRQVVELLEFSSEEDLQFKEKSRFFHYVKKWNKEIEEFSYKLESAFACPLFTEFKQANSLQFIRKLHTKNFFNRILEEKSEEIELDELGKNSKEIYIKCLDAYEAEDYEKSSEDIKRLLILNPNKAFLYVQAGKIMHAKNNFNESLDYFDKAISLDESNAKAYSEKAKVFNDLRRHDKALECFNHAIYNGMNDTEDYFNRGLAEYQLKKYEEAITSFSVALELDPLSIASWEFRGNSNLNMGNYNEALNCYNEILKIDPRDLEALNYKGLCLIEMKKYSEGLACLDKAIEIDPRDSLSYNNKGNCLMTLHKYEEALEVLNKGLECNLQNPTTYYNKGACLYELKQYDQSLLSFEMACMLDSNSARNFNARGLVLLRLGKKDEALRAFERSIQIEPMPVGYTNIAEILLEDQKYDECDRICDKSLAFAKNAPAYFIKGKIREAKGIYYEAVELYNTSLEVDPRVKDVYICKVRCLRKMGREADASKIERMIVDVIPANAKPSIMSGK